MATHTFDDNARKFITDTLPISFLQENSARSYTLIVDWLETSQDNEKKLAYKAFDNGTVQMLLIQKVTKDGSRSTEKTILSKEEYEELLTESILHLEKTRHEFSYSQNGISFSLNYDEFTQGGLRMLEVDAATEDERSAFDPGPFPAQLTEVTGDLKYYGFRVAETINGTL